MAKGASSPAAPAAQLSPDVPSIAPPPAPAPDNTPPTIPDDARLAAWQNPGNAALQAAATAPGTPGAPPTIEPNMNPGQTAPILVRDTKEVKALDAAATKAKAEGDDQSAAVFQQGVDDWGAAQHRQEEFQRKTYEAKVASDKQLEEARKVLANTKPEDYYGSSRIAGNVLGAIGVALGSFGAGMTHGQNTALGLLQGAQQDFAEKQKMIIDNKWKAYAEQKGLANDANERDLAYGKVMAQSQQLWWNHVADQVKAIGMKSISPATKAAAAQFALQLDEKAAGYSNMGAAYNAAAAGAGASALKKENDKIDATVDAQVAKYQEGHPGLTPEEIVAARTKFKEGLVAASPYSVPLIKGGYGSREQTEDNSIPGVNAGLKKIVADKVADATKRWGRAPTPEEVDAIKRITLGEVLKSSPRLIPGSSLKYYDVDPSTNLFVKKPAVQPGTAFDGRPTVDNLQQPEQPAGPDLRSKEQVDSDRKVLQIHNSFTPVISTLYKQLSDAKASNDDVAIQNALARLRDNMSFYEKESKRAGASGDSSGGTAASEAVKLLDTYIIKPELFTDKAAANLGEEINAVHIGIMTTYGRQKNVPNLVTPFSGTGPGKVAPGSVAYQAGYRGEGIGSPRVPSAPRINFVPDKRQ